MNQEASCEHYETLLSTWIDQGIGLDEQRETLDHLAECPSCRAFYRDARLLDGLVAVAGAERAFEEPAPAVWEKIRDRTESREVAVAGLPSWAWRAAAVLLLGAALAFVPWPIGEPPVADGKRLNIVLEGDRDSMTEGRFLELAGELLRADRRYHFAMQEVMERVIDDEWQSESGSGESVTEEDVDGRGEDESSRVRV